jgi:histidyl-tRNA synthetase
MNKSNIPKNTWLKVAKGTQDNNPSIVLHREKAINILKNIFKKNGGQPIDTSVLELTKTLNGNYGDEANKLIYNLESKNNNPNNHINRCSLRYDLTIPFARYLAINSIDKMKRYQIGRVYRRDKFVPSQGRFREFYQCDFDIAGQYDNMVPDAEIISILCQSLKALLGDISYSIRINNRVILEELCKYCGVPDNMFISVCTTLDKMDKMSWDNIIIELKNKLLSDDTISKLGDLMCNTKMSNNDDTLKYLDEILEGHPVINEMKQLFEYLKSYGIYDVIKLDISLARGLDYYTGVIYEATCSVTKGSIAGGGRYDNLVGMFSGRKVPIVGCSIGLDRILSFTYNNELEHTTSIFVCSENDMINERIQIVTKLRQADIATETFMYKNMKLSKQLQYASQNKIPIIIIIKKLDYGNGIVTIKHMPTKSQNEIPINDLISNVKKIIITDTN